MYANKVITSVLKEDAMWLGMSLDSAKKDRDAIVNVVKRFRTRPSWQYFVVCVLSADENYTSERERKILRLTAMRLSVC